MHAVCARTRKQKRQQIEVPVKRARHMAGQWWLISCQPVSPTIPGMEAGALIYRSGRHQLASMIMMLFSATLRLTAHANCLTCGANRQSSELLSKEEGCLTGLPGKGAKAPAIGGVEKSKPRDCGACVSGSLRWATIQRGCTSIAARVQKLR